MRNNLFRDTALLVAAVLLTTAFWSCSKSKEEAPEPTPPAVSVTGVTLDKSSISILVGASETLAATVSPKDAANKKVTWKSSNAAIASVDANGKVTGVKAGEATITVTTEDGGKTATCKVTVSATSVAVTGVTLNKTELTLETGGSETLTATVAPSDAANKNVTWKSSNTAVATVDDNGKVTGVAAGEATITVTTEDGGKTATCKVSVLPSVKKVTVEPATLTLGKKKSYTLKATVEVSGSGTDTGVTWTSSDETIATVDATGTVTATDKVGTVTITATSVVDPTKKGTCTVTVSADQVGIEFGGYGPEENW